MKTADPELMRAINRFLIMDAIRRFGPVARVELSERTELSPTTVSAITASLLEDGLIVPRAAGGLHEPSRGRPRTLLELNPGAASVVGVMVAAGRITGVVTDFRGDVLSELAMPVRIARQTADVAADLVEDAVRHCVAEAGLAIEDITEVCVGVPGLVEHDTGTVRGSPTLLEADVPLGEALKRRLGRTTTVESCASAVAFAESWFGQARAYDDFIVVKAGETIELCVVHKGEILRGANGLSSDLGALSVVAPDRRNEGYGRLADLATEGAILGAAGLNGNGSGGASALARLARAGAAAEGGDEAAAEVLRRAGSALGSAIANLVVIFAPRLVILTGSLAGAGDGLLRPLHDRMAIVVPAALAGMVRVVVAEPDDRHWARGAAALALRDLYGAPWNTTGPARRT